MVLYKVFYFVQFSRVSKLVGDFLSFPCDAYIELGAAMLGECFYVFLY